MSFDPFAFSADDSPARDRPKIPRSSAVRSLNSSKSSAEPKFQNSRSISAAASFSPSTPQISNPSKLSSNSETLKRNRSEMSRSSKPSAAARFNTSTIIPPASAAPNFSFSDRESASDSRVLDGADRDRMDEINYLIDGCRSREPLAVRQLSALKLFSSLNSANGPALFFLIRTAGGFHSLGESFNGCEIDPVLTAAFTGIMFAASREKSNSPHLGIATLKNLMSLALAKIENFTGELNAEGEEENVEETPSRSNKRSRKRVIVKISDIWTPLSADPALRSNNFFELSPTIVAVAAAVKFSEDPRFRVFLLHSNSLQTFSDTIREDFQRLREIENSSRTLSEKIAANSALEFRISSLLQILENLTHLNQPTQILLLATKFSNGENSGFFIDLLFEAVHFFTRQQIRQSNNQPEVSVESTIPGSINLVLSIFRLLVNLTNKNSRGSAALSRVCQAAENLTGTEIILNLLEFSFRYKNSAIERKKSEIAAASDVADELTLALALLINAAELSEELRNSLAFETREGAAASLLVEIFAASYRKLRELAQKKIEPQENSAAQDGEALSDRICCSYSGLLLAILATHSEAATIKFVSLLQKAQEIQQRRDGSTSGGIEAEAPLSLKLVALVMREFLLLQSEASLLTQDTLETIVKLIEKLEKTLRKQEIFDQFNEEVKNRTEDQENADESEN